MRRWITHLSLFALLAAGIFSVSAPVAAQDTDVLQVAIQLCDDASCATFGDRVPQVLVSAIDHETNDVLASCTTDAGSQSGGCGMQIPVGADYFLTWNTTPAGYTYFGSNIVADDGPGGPITLIPFVPSSSIPHDINVNAATCTDATCSDFADFLIDFEIQALDDTTNGVLDSCFTSGGSQFLGCILTIPAGTSYYLSWDQGGVPAGYEFYGVITSDGQMGPVVSTLAFSPIQEPVVEAINVNAALCIDADCANLGDFLIDFEIRAYDDSNNALLDTCFTDGGSQFLGCILHIPTGTQFFLGWDDAQVPDGYEFHGVIVSDGQMGPVVRTLTFAPSDGPVLETVLVNAATCTDAACSDLADFFIDFEIQARDSESDAVLDTCLTDGGSQFLGCALHIPAGAVYYFDWDPAAVPDGFEFYDVLVSDGHMGPVVHTLAFAPETPGTKTPTPDPTHAPTKTPTKAPATSTAVSGLPTTGAAGGNDSGSAISLLVLATGLLAASALAIGSRRFVRTDR